MIIDFWENSFVIMASFIMVLITDLWDPRTFPILSRNPMGSRSVCCFLGGASTAGCQHPVTQDPLVNLTMGSDEIIYPILHFHKRSSGIEDGNLWE